MTSVIFNNIKLQIEATVDPGKVDREVSKKARPFVNQVCGGLYLGNDLKFVEIIPIECKTKKGMSINTTNPNQFKCAVSVCAYERIVREMPDLKKYSAKEIEEKLENIEWIQVGRAIPDDNLAWYDIVFNSTFPGSDLAKIDLEIERNSQVPEHMAHRAKKKNQVENTPVEEWFEKTFEVLDKAVVEGRKTLVHCHAGASRTGALVTAYLIKRCKVSTEQAIAFLRTKRVCINPKCIADLNAYAEKLHGIAK
jgi:hypothetical protein